MYRLESYGLSCTRGLVLYEDKMHIKSIYGIILKVMAITISKGNLCIVPPPYEFYIYEFSLFFSHNAMLPNSSYSD